MTLLSWGVAVLVVALPQFDRLLDPSGGFRAAFFWPSIALAGLLIGTVSAVLMVGAAKMRRLRGYGLAATASILAMIPWSPGWLIGLPSGICACIVLGKPGVVEAYLSDDRKAGSGSRLTPKSQGFVAGWFRSLLRSVGGYMIPTLPGRKERSLMQACLHATAERFVSNGGGELVFSAGCGSATIRYASASPARGHVQRKKGAFETYGGRKFLIALGYTMFIKSNLFSKGHAVSGQRSLSEVLENHKRGILAKIGGISDLDQMTDAFLQQLVKDSIVEPLAIQFDKMTRKLRTEGLDGSLIPENSLTGRMRRSGQFSDAELFGEGGNKRQVARLSIPFTGDPTLLQFAPNPCGIHLPKGEVNGNTIHFDVILWGLPDDAQRVQREIQRNRELIAACASAINKQVKEFNESLPTQVKAAFTAKLDELTKQHSIFDDLGIPEEPDPPASPSGPTTTRTKKGKASAGTVIQIIDKMYVEQFNQTNYNVGDVNNAIQSN